LHDIDVQQRLQRRDSVVELREDFKLKRSVVQACRKIARESEANES
jgi:hypothetical protein